MASAAYQTQAAYLDGVDRRALVTKATEQVRLAYERFLCAESAFARDYGLVYGKALWVARKQLNDAGYGQLSDFLHNLNIPRRTAYDWIRKYEISVGLKTEAITVRTAPVTTVVAVPFGLRTTDESLPNISEALKDALRYIPDFPAFEQVPDISDATPLLRTVSENTSIDRRAMSETKRLNALFLGDAIRVRPCKSKDGLKSVVGKFVVIGLTAKQVEMVAKMVCE